MIDWIKQGIEKAIPQPEIPIRSKAEEKPEAPASAKAEPPAPEPAAPKPATDTDKPSKEAEQQPNMVGWIVSGIGRIFPQPVPKQDAGSDDVQNISIGQKSTDLVLEDIEQDNDKEAKQEKETEDAGTAVTDSIEKEERLQEERLEAARIAEEMARKAAEEAVRQLEVEHSAKIVIETLPESNEQLPNILEEENEDDPECAPDLCPPKEQDTPSSTAVEPASEKRDLESPVTQQPEPQAPEAPTTTTEEAKAAGAAEGGEGGVPDICSAIMSFLLRFPHAVECLESCRSLMHDHYLTPPTIHADPAA
ncbi:hypothetical protein D5F01_LYC06691 [Larimichthys crocea]|uniref:Cyclic nucleotide-gated cation channel beta-1 n=1 Tax=Larimichthys crocea TaxID=215358 RepID=A0A6G0IQF5_LARCR|nr:hypothetical protein D5F01_LYC06691 [Larimichthys crocea]